MRLFCILVFLPALASSQTISFGARSMALSSQETLIAEDAGSAFFNPALLSQAPQLSAWLNYYRPFNLAEVKFQALAVNYRRGKAALGAGALAFGNEIYSEQQFTLAGCYALSGNFVAGASINRRQVRIEGYGSAGSVFINLGLRIPASEALSFGVLIKNLYASRLGKSEEKAAPRLVAGLRFQPVQQASIYLEVAQERYFPVMVRVAAEVRPLAFLPLRVGTGVNTPESFAAGFGLVFSRFRLDYALQNHPALQQSHVFSLSLVLKP